MLYYICYICSAVCDCAGLCGGAAVPQQQRGPGPGPGLLRPTRRGPGGGRHRAGTYLDIYNIYNTTDDLQCDHQSDYLCNIYNIYNIYKLGRPSSGSRTSGGRVSSRSSSCCPRAWSASSACCSGPTGELSLAEQCHVTTDHADLQERPRLGHL